MLNNSALIKNLINLDDETEDFLEKKLRENEKNIQAIANHSKLDISSSLRSINDLHLKNNEKRLSQISSLNQSEIKSIEQNNPKKENTANVSSQQIYTFTSSSQKNIHSNINMNISSINNYTNNEHSSQSQPMVINMKHRKKTKKFPQKINYGNYNLCNSFYFDANNCPDINYHYINYLKFNEYADFLYPSLLRSRSAQKRAKNKNISFDYTYSNINHIIQRSIETQQKKNAKIEQLKKIKEDNEIKECSHKPKISKKSQEIASHVNDDFYTRQKKLIIEQNKREDLMKKKYRNFELYKFHRENDKNSIINSSLNIRSHRKNINEIEDYNDLVYNMNKQKIQKQKNKNKSQVKLIESQNLDLNSIKKSRYSKKKKELTKSCLYLNTYKYKRKDMSAKKNEKVENYYKNSENKNKNNCNNTNNSVILKENKSNKIQKIIIRKKIHNLNKKNNF